MGKWVGEEYRWTADEKIADMTSGLYGAELAEKEAELTDLVAGVRRDWSAKLRELAVAAGTGMTASGLYEAAREINPDTPDTV